jgi:competence protein ComEC
VLASWAPPLAFEPVVQLAGWVASGTVRALHAVAELPGATLAVGAVSQPAAVLAALGVGVALPAHPLPGRRLGWVALLPLFWPASSAPAHGDARVVALDVGHGLAVVVETHAHRLLFDAGPTFPSGFDVGEEVVLPALGASGRGGLDALLVSHADNDHAGGARAVIAAFPGAAVLHGPDVQALGGRRCERGQSWEWDGVRFDVLHPRAADAARGNDSSCVLKVSATRGTVLLTGDVEARGEAALVQGDARSARAELAADVVVVPHHGSATSSTPAFVAAAHASHAVVSAGYKNRWGFPKPEVRARWERAGANVLVTGESGAVTIELRASGIAVRAERDVRHHYWDPFAKSAPRP